MLGLDATEYFAGIGWGMTVPDSAPKRRNPRKEFIGAGPGWMAPGQLHTMSTALDELVASFGPRVYQAMLTDSTVRSAYGSLKLGILEGGLSLTSPVKMPAWSTTPKAPKGKGDAKPGKPDDKAEPGDKGKSKGAPEPEPSGRVLSPEQEQARDVLDFCQRGVDRLAESLDATLFSLLDAMAFGCKLSEVTCTVPREGVDAGKLVLGSVKVRPDWAWRFLVDSFLNVKGILTWSPVDGNYVVVDPGKFGWLTWMPEDGDPRGTSILRAAYAAWNLKIQSWPMYYAHLVRFGSPGVDVEMAENDTEDRQPLDGNGNEIPAGQADPVSATQFIIGAVRHYKNGGVLAHPSGSKVNVFEPRTNGEAFRLAIELFDRQICLAIEMQARATLEAKNGSKADSETAQDTKGLVTSYGRRTLAGVLRGILRRNVRDNFGDDAAERYTPIPRFGGAEHQDRPALLTALGSVGYTLSPSQLNSGEVDAMAGLPVRDPEEDAKAAADAMEQMQAITGGTPGASGETPPKPGAKPGKPAPEPKPKPGTAK